MGVDLASEAVSEAAQSLLRVSPRTPSFRRVQRPTAFSPRILKLPRTKLSARPSLTTMARRSVTRSRPSTVACNPFLSVLWLQRARGESNPGPNPRGLATPLPGGLPTRAKSRAESLFQGPLRCSTWLSYGPTENRGLQPAHKAFHPVRGFASSGRKASLLVSSLARV